METNVGSVFRALVAVDKMDATVARLLWIGHVVLLEDQCVLRTRQPIDPEVMVHEG